MQPGGILQGYELRERIGSGGFGVVHRAYQTTLAREVAIKIILPHFANHPDFIRRFEAEAQLVARLEHPYIVPLYDYWRDPDGAYLVMRWLRGGNLQDALAQGAYPLEAAALLVDQIGSALALAHRSNVVHRDLKPANILLDEDGNTYLSDFGIAKENAQAEAALTGSGMLPSWLDYVAPEQARIEAVTPQADIYSLGVVLYHVLTGQHPFADVTSVERLYRHLNEPLPLIDTSATEVSDGLNAIIQKATAKNPAQRYGDVLELVADFRRVVSLNQTPPKSLVEELTLREQEILQMIADGWSNKQIADELFITVGTVRWHIRQLNQKLHVRSRVQAILRARELRLIGSDRVYQPLADRVGGVALHAPENPYKGLRAFQTADSRDFFGREHLVQRIISRLGERHKLARFLAIVGPSGSGKSSIVKAGLIPALWRGELPGSDRWFVVNLVPGAHPFDELEISLTHVATDQCENLRAQLDRDERGLARVAELILPVDDSELVVIVDQFEELFTLVQDELTRSRFMDLLYAAVTDPRSRVRVITALRADFYDRPLHYPRFGELMLARMETILPLSATELEAAIVKPAERVGVTFEPGLVATIASDIHYQPGALPLLQYALTELFEERANGTLTYDAYQRLGGAAGTLTKRAEELFHEHDPEGQSIVRQMFLRLVTLGEGTEDTRRRVARSELLALAGDTEQMNEAIDTFAAFRLLTLDHHPATRKPTVEIAHEAILREWGRLRAWLAQSRHDIHQQRLLGEAATAWSTAGSDPSYLLHGARLEQFAGWAEHTSLALTDAERAFLDFSLAERERQGAAERARQQQELETQRQLAEKRQQSARRLRYLVAALTVFLVAALGLSGLAIDRERAASRARAASEASLLRAEREVAVNQSLVLSSTAQQQFESGNSDLALALALEAVNLEQAPPETVRTLSTVALGMGTRALLRDQGGSVDALAFSPDSRLALSGGCAVLDAGGCTQGELIVWDVATARELRTVSGEMGSVTSVVFDPTDGQRALVGSDDGLLYLWNIETGELLRSFRGHTDGVRSVAFGSDGTMALSGSDDHTAILWDVASAQIIRPFEGHQGGVTAVAFSPDERAVVGGGDATDPAILMWDVETSAVIRSFVDPTATVLDVNFRIDEQGLTLLCALSSDNVYREWNGETGLMARSIAVANTPSGITLSPDGLTELECEGNQCNLMDLRSWTSTAVVVTPSRQLVSANAVSPDGRYALIGSDAGELLLLNLPASPEVRRLHSPGGLNTVDISPDGKYLLTGSYDGGTAILWDAQTGDEVRRLEGLSSMIPSTRFSPDGRLALIISGEFMQGSGEPTVVLWDVATGEIVHELSGWQYLPRVGEFSPDGRTVLIGTLQWGTRWKEEGVKGELTLCDVATGEVIRQFGPTRSVLEISFSPDGRTAVTAHSIYDKVTLWDVATGRAIRQVDHLAKTVAFTSDPRYFLTGSEGGFIVLVDAETGADVRTFSAPNSAFWALDLSSDEKYLLGGGHQGMFALWDFQTGEELQRFWGRSFSTVIWNIAFSPQGQTVFSTSFESQSDLIEWRVGSWTLDELQRWVRDNRYVRELTCDERAQYRIEPLCGEGEPGDIGSQSR